MHRLEDQTANSTEVATSVLPPTQQTQIFEFGILL